MIHILDMVIRYDLTNPQPPKPLFVAFRGRSLAIMRSDTEKNYEY
jgi:hypothetical protein